MMRLATSAAAALVLVGLAAHATAGNPAGAPPSSPKLPTSISLTSEEAQLVQITNVERVRAGLRPLAVNTALTLAAREHSQDMCKKDYFSHIAPVASLARPMQRYLAQLPEEPDYAIVGENLYYCSDVRVQGAHDALMKSPGHRENIMDERYDSIGIGVYKASSGFWVTQMFLASKSPD